MKFLGWLLIFWFPAYCFLVLDLHIGLRFAAFLSIYVGAMMVEDHFEKKIPLDR